MKREPIAINCKTLRFARVPTRVLPNAASGIRPCRWRSYRLRGLFPPHRPAPDALVLPNAPDQPNEPNQSHSQSSSNASDRSAAEPQILQVLTTVAQMEDAQRLAHQLVQRRLAACVQIESAIRSVYRWENEVHNDAEFRLTAKTTRDRFAALCACLEDIHPYDVPEIIATPVVCGGAAYLQWVAQQVSE